MISFYHPENHTNKQQAHEKRVFIFFFLIIPLSCFSQQPQPQIWYFGYNAGIDFTSGSPVVLNNSAMSQWEGVATACDSLGNLLFYSDGMQVWNKNHQVMPNGTGLMGNSSCTQSATVVPQPGHPNQYYLFTCPEISNTNGLRYSIIDMTLNSGLGDVTSVKNVLLLGTANEQCAVIPAGAGSVWLVTRELAPDWHAFLIDSSGIYPPVVSTAGTQFQTPVGYMKASPLHNKIGIANYDYTGATSYFEIYDFDTATGLVSNAFQLSLGWSVYGCEFSPDGTKFYGAQWGTTIYQYDLTAGTAADIAASQVQIGTSAYDYVGDLQIGPDQKIYCAINNGAYLSVIDSPNNSGTSCNFINNAFYLGGSQSGIGLPSIEVFTNPAQTFVAFNSSSTEVCEKFCLSFFDSSTNNPTSWLWLFPGGAPATSTDQNPAQICYQVPGVYDVTLITTNASGSDTLTLPDYITVNPSPPFPVITQSGFTLTSSTAAGYQWQYDGIDIAGATSQSYDIEQSGYYTVVISDSNGCTSSSSVDIVIEGVEDLSDDPTIRIYPNPSDGDFIVQLTDASVGDVVLIRVMNVTGQVIYSSEESRSIGMSVDLKKEVDLGSDARHRVSTGVYFIEIKSADNFARKKIVIGK